MCHIERLCKFNRSFSFNGLENEFQKYVAQFVENNMPIVYSWLAYTHLRNSAIKAQCLRSILGIDAQYIAQ